MASNRIRRNSKRLIIFLDTSAIFMIFELTIRIEEELTRLLGIYEIFILRSVYNEIVQLQKHGSEKQKRLAKLALQYIQRYPLFDDMVKPADDALVNEAKKIDAIVFTNDVVLRKRLKKNNIKCICLRGKNQLMLE
jgi:uncharacterized protein